jgi:hypothetical protein
VSGKRRIKVEELSQSEQEYKNNKNQCDTVVVGLIEDDEMDEH